MILKKIFSIAIIVMVVVFPTTNIFAQGEEGKCFDMPEQHEDIATDPFQGHSVAAQVQAVQSHKIFEEEVAQAEGYVQVSSNKIEYTDYELYMLAGVIMSEAGYTDNIQKAFVGSVVLNRVSDPRFPNTIEKVLTQEGQYSTVRRGRFKLEPDASSLVIARELLENGSALPANVVWQANHKQGKEVYVKYNNMYYCM